MSDGRWRVIQGEEVREKEKDRDIAHHLSGVNQQVKLLLKSKCVKMVFSFLMQKQRIKNEE